MELAVLRHECVDDVDPGEEVGGGVVAIGGPGGGRRGERLTVGRGHVVAEHQLPLALSIRIT